MYSHRHERRDGGNVGRQGATWTQDLARADSMTAHDDKPSESDPPPSLPPLSMWERATFGLIHGSVALLYRMLGLNGLYRFGGAFGTIEWLINYKRRRRFAKALARVLDHKPTGADRRRITRAYFRRTRCDKIFQLVFDCLPREQAKGLVEITNREVFDPALARGKGLYLAFPHHGAHHVVGMLVALNGYKTVGVRDRKEGALRRYLQHRYEERFPEFRQTRVLFADSYPRDIYRALQEGCLLASAIDVSRIRQAHQKSIEVEMFGQRRALPTGPMRVALKCGTPIIQAFPVPTEGFRYRLEIVDMLIDPEQVEDPEQAIAEAMQTYATTVEAHVRQSPHLITRV